MSELDKLADNIRKTGMQSKQAQLRFVSCVSVDWKNRIMVANGVSDGVPYYGVMLGFGYVDIKPKKDTLCLIGILEGKENYSFLINAEEVEEVEMNFGKMTINDGKNYGIVKIAELVKKINKLESELNNLKTVFKTWAVAPSDGGLALKSAASIWAGKTIITTKQSDLENDKIKH